MSDVCCARLATPSRSLASVRCVYSVGERTVLLLGLMQCMLHVREVCQWSARRARALTRGNAWIGDLVLACLSSQLPCVKRFEWPVAHERQSRQSIYIMLVLCSLAPHAHHRVLLLAHCMLPVSALRAQTALCKWKRCDAHRPGHAQS